MTDKELRKLSRSDLLEILLEQSKEISGLQAENKKLKEQIEDRTIQYQNSGSLAEAALKVTGIFDDAQKAADLYLENLKKDGADIEAVQKKCAEMEKQSRQTAKRLLDKTAAECAALREETEKVCREMIAEAEKKTNG